MLQPTHQITLFLSFYFLLIQNCFSSPYTTGDFQENYEPQEVDKIEKIEIQPTQFVIVTTKEGPGTNLRVRLELTDLHENRLLPPIDVQGIWVMITRGRYTIPFLKPDRWYGLHFRSENIINNKHVIHSEDRLLRTATRNHTSNDHLFEVEMKNTLDGQENLESKYITVKWNDEERINGSVASVSLRVICNSSITKDTINLSSDDDSITVEVTMDNKYEIAEINKDEHEVTARITPLKCHRVCWYPKLEIKHGNHEFSRGYPEKCESLHGTTTTSYLRNIKQYKIERNSSSDAELVLETEMKPSNEDAIVVLKAHQIGDNNSSVESASFSTMDLNGTFRLPLESDSIYAVDYEYTKIKPFHYFERESFLVETPSNENSSADLQPIQFKFEPETFQMKPDQKVVDSPTVVLLRGTAFDSQAVTVHLKPFCEHNSKEIVLNSTYPHHDIDVTRLICSQKSTFRFCDKKTKYEECSPILCHSISIKMQNVAYPSSLTCINVTKHFDMNSAPTLYIFSIILLTLSISMLN